MKLACETCPWSVTFRHNEHTFVSCRNAQRVQGHEDCFTPDYWCSLHPLAPKPIYEMVTLHPSTKMTRLADGLEPISIAGTDEDWGILCRRIVCYTEGGER